MYIKLILCVACFEYQFIERNKMVQIIYNQSLLKNIGQHSSKGLIRKPFNNWYVSPLYLNNHQYYLLTEVESHLPIIIDKIDSDQFQEVLDVVIEHFDFLCEDQKEWLTEDCCSDFTFSSTNRVPIGLIKTVQEIEQSPTIFLGKAIDLFKENTRIVQIQ